ncbi:MAG TPA: hypothetical protein VH307_19240 [Streptosporangiaceae bacterium]|nr:hypothetical protein [Streptosporangiaceae bacterium]
MPGYLARTLDVTGLQVRHAAAWFSVRQAVVALVFVAVFIAFLAGPILAEALFDFFSKGVERAAPGGFFLGLGVLLIGLASGIEILDIAGGCLIGLIVLAVIVDNYLPSMPAGAPWPGLAGVRKVGGSAEPELTQAGRVDGHSQGLEHRAVSVGEGVRQR